MSRGCQQSPHGGAPRVHWGPLARVLLARPTALTLLLMLAACGSQEFPFSANEPARGPGELTGQDTPLNDEFEGGYSPTVETLDAESPSDGSLPDCDAACRAHCASLTLENPLDRALCPSAWGVGLGTRPVALAEACRRMFIDTQGSIPSLEELDTLCPASLPGGADRLTALAHDLIRTESFLTMQRRYWADLLLYNNEALSVERIYDLDDLVARMYEGRVAYDAFAAVVSAHPVMTRRNDTPGDRAEALFNLLLGRPPYENERADMARLYVLWSNGYYDHPQLQQRLPDAVIQYRCVDDEGRVDEAARGACTSILWGYNPLVLEPDARANEGQMWSGLLSAQEWHALQLPGRILASELGFWEHAADRVLQRYLGYDLGAQVPAVRQALMDHLIAHGGDLRAAHHAVLTSRVYLQSSRGESDGPHRWTHGPLKQIEVEAWLDSVLHATGHSLGICDPRLPDPDELLRDDSPHAYALVEASAWDLNDDARVDTEYSELARTLGGCPLNDVPSRFKTISILSTATQQGFVATLCNPGNEPESGVDVGSLLPASVSPDRALDSSIAGEILAHQTRSFLGREASSDEVDRARAAAERCVPSPCNAEQFARPMCYALLSSAEMLFY